MTVNPFKNFLLKVSAFALALLLWVHVATNRTYEYQLNIPIRVVDVPEGLILISEPANNLPVNIRATGKQLISLAMKEPQIEVSVADYDSGFYRREIVESDVLATLQRPYESFEITVPTEVNLRLEPLVEKVVAVRARNLVEAALGFAIMSPLLLEPESVRVSGPASVVNNLRYLETDSTGFLDLDKPLREEIGLQIPESLRLNLSDSTVFVSVAVEAKKQKLFTGVAITPPRNFSTDKYAIVPETLSFRLEIPESQVDSFGVDKFVISFKRPPIMRDSARAAIRWLLPENVEVVGPKLDSLLIISKS